MSAEQTNFNEITKCIDEFLPKRKEKIMGLVEEIETIIKKDPQHSMFAVAYIGAKLSLEILNEVKL